MSHKIMSINRGDKLVGATLRKVIGQQALCWSLSGNYDVLVRHTVTTLMAEMLSSKEQ